MDIKIICNQVTRGLICTASCFLFICFCPGFSVGGEMLDAKAEEMFKSMSSYLGGTRKLTVDADVDFEIVTSDGQKLQLSSNAKFSIERPSKLHVERVGMGADVYVIYDGETLSLYGKRTNSYGQLTGSGTIDDAFMIYEMETGMAGLGAGLILSDPYDALTGSTESSSYIGVGYVNGVKCNHLAFRDDKVDWQLWVQAGDTPLPMKLIITSKFLPAGPQYEVRFRNWNTNPKIDDKIFTFVPPDGARKVESLPTEELQHFISADDVVMARQTMRKIITRTEISVSILPENCIPVVLQGLSLKNCEGTYYLLEDTHYVMVDVD